MNTVAQTPKKISDYDARLRALEPTGSFIVQAPAGSGKTGLLTQRFLVLLARVKKPEEIIAITFTKKAAAEMKQRILHALKQAQSQTIVSSDFEQQTNILAQLALQQNEKNNWQLLQNPNRLQILTIDALCAQLAQQMPIGSQLGATPQLQEDARELYEEAAKNTLNAIEQDEDWSPSVRYLALHLDNNLEKIKSLISDMLAKRDQWLRHIVNTNNPQKLRQILEANLQTQIENHLAQLIQLIPAEIKADLVALARYAGDYLSDNSTTTNSKIIHCANLKQLPDDKLSSLNQWLGIAELLLTKKGTWLKKVTKTTGFPAESTATNATQKIIFAENKEHITTLLASLADNTLLQQQLALLTLLPPAQYNDQRQQWQSLENLMETLKMAAVNLNLVFTNRGEVDFAAITQAALSALGGNDEPTDLALALDYRISHLLVDEFQDTSFNQLELLTRLTAGWQNNDGRSLFVVGDPMQSIYRFREADVSLFLNAKQYGIGQIQLEPLQLEVNFRSQQGIVEWINQNFPSVMPAQDQPSMGAVSYAPSTAFHQKLNGDAVQVYPSIKNGNNNEAEQIVKIIKQTKQLDPKQTTAILVRSRPHLIPIIQQLQQNNIRFKAIEIDSLAQRVLILDLLALTRALHHLADRVAWLSILRAPYCGFGLKDLYTIAGNEPVSTIFELLQQETVQQKLSNDGKTRLARILPILQSAQLQSARSPLHQSVKRVWLALGGPACVQNDTDLKDADVFFQLLEKTTNNTTSINLHKLEKKIGTMYAMADVDADDSLQLLTIHKAKGLEFDHVILPSLEKKTRADDKKLLSWLELTDRHSKKSLLLAPIHATKDEKDGITNYISHLEKQKAHYESTRLLYVALTRAKQSLHLFGQVKTSETKKDELKLSTPINSSLLNKLWCVLEPTYQKYFDKNKHQINNKIEETTNGKNSARYRLSSSWQLPSPPPNLLVNKPENSITLTNESPETETKFVVEFEWAGEVARHTGTVVHRLLQTIGEVGIENNPLSIERIKKISSTMLVQQGIPKQHLKTAQDKVEQAIQTTLNNEKGQWILSNKHQQSQCEFAITSVYQHKVQHYVIDRTFIDEQGTRWIIDYKTGSHLGSNKEQFLNQEQQRYKTQLENYAKIMTQMEDRPIRLALYFPLMDAWREWAYQ